MGTGRAGGVTMQRFADIVFDFAATFGVNL
jgi:hypothetical protein